MPAGFFGFQLPSRSPGNGFGNLRKRGSMNKSESLKKVGKIKESEG